MIMILLVVFICATITLGYVVYKQKKKRKNIISQYKREIVEVERKNQRINISVGSIFYFVDTTNVIEEVRGKRCKIISVRYGSFVSIFVDMNDNPYPGDGQTWTTSSSFYSCAIFVNDNNSNKQLIHKFI